MHEAQLPLADAVERSQQLVAIAQTSAADIAATCTAFPIMIESLGFKCFYYRTFVGRRHRSIGLWSEQLAYRMLVKSYHLLNDRFRAGCDQDVLGVYLEIENPKIQKIRSEPVWQSGGVQFVYVGKTASQGKHCRAAYFDGARIP